MWKKTFITLTTLLSLWILWGVFSAGTGSLFGNGDGSDAVREENGIQYIRIFARGGYSPSQITAKANIPTVLEVETKGTYDCSAALTIPAFSYQQFLPATGVTKIGVPKEAAVNTLDILCSMGMYGTRIYFNP